MRSTVSVTSSGRSIPRKALKSSCASNCAGRTSVLPASILARSSRSFTSSVRSSAALATNFTCVCCSSTSGPSSCDSSIPQSARMEFNGVRNSWLMLDRNRDFISEARRR